MTEEPSGQIVKSWLAEDGTVACLIEIEGSDALALAHDPPPTQATVLEAASRFLPGREPFKFRRAFGGKVVYVYPLDAWDWR